MKKILFLISILSIIVLFDTISFTLSAQRKRSQVAIQKKLIQTPQMVAIGPDFVIKNVNYNTVLRCNDPLLTVTAEVWNIGNRNYDPNVKIAEFYLDLADTKTNDPIHCEYWRMNQVINKGTYQTRSIILKYSDMRFSENLKTAKTLNLVMFADAMGEVSELDEMNNAYWSDKKIINNCNFFYLQSFKKYPKIRVKKIKKFKLLAKITKVVNNPSMGIMGPDAELEIHGNLFGASQGTKCIQMGPYTIKNTGVWGPKFIVFVVLPSLNIPYGRRYGIYLKDGNGKRISNIYKYVLKMYIDGFDPSSGSPRSKTVIHGYQFGTTQGIKKVIIGTKIAQVIKWSDQKIAIKIPHLPPGKYDTYLKRHTLTISNKKSFTVK